MALVGTSVAATPCRRCRVAALSYDAPDRRCWQRLALRFGCCLAGWTLLSVGLLLLVLPGPGTMLSIAGLHLLSREHVWAQRWVVPWERRVRAGVRASVATRVALAWTALVVLLTVAAAVLWSWGPAAPGWWPASGWWLPGGLAMGVGFASSAVVMVVVSGSALRTLRTAG